MNQIKETMVKVRSDKTMDARTEAAEHLARLTHKISDKEVTEAFVTDITSLLDSPDDSVRYWVVIALGNLGPDAKSAAPKLEQMLTEADCLDGIITSASGIRYALIRMGIKPPAPADCQRIEGYPQPIAPEKSWISVTGRFLPITSFAAARQMLRVPPMVQRAAYLLDLRVCFACYS